MERIQTAIPGMDKKSYNDIWDSLTLQAAYFSQLPLNPSEIGKYTKPCVLLCESVTWDKTNYWDCSNSIRVRWDPIYYLCYTIAIPNNQSQVCIIA